MLKSMTGFGRSEMQINGREISVEIKSVNHRYFEFSCRTPKGYGFLDDKLKAFVSSKSAARALYTWQRSEKNKRLVRLSASTE